jgi:hypothetical protein
MNAGGVVIRPAVEYSAVEKISIVVTLPASEGP